MNLRPPPEVVYYVTTKPTTSRDRRALPHHRFYAKLAQAMMFWKYHPTRERRFYRGVVTWEEVNVGGEGGDAGSSS